MGKLVRDKIPDIIRASGRVPIQTILAEGEYRTALIDKLNEEVAELAAADDAGAVIEEAADILEVVAAIVAGCGATINDVLDVARRKRSERGGFDLRICLEGLDGAESACESSAIGDVI